MPPSSPQNPDEQVPCVHCAESHSASYSHCPKTGRALGTGKALIGRAINRRYVISRILGEGGMGTVYEARDEDTGEHVAIKRLHPELACDLVSVRRFQREARAAGSTGHRNVVEVRDHGFGTDGAPFIVMERLRGQSLNQYLDAHRTMLPGRACRMMREALAGLEAVHAAGVIHRDLKPENIFLISVQNRRAVKLLDFGVSKMSPGPDHDEETLLTRPGVTMGTPSYMSPEQARGRPDIDHRVDLYAVGVILYRCLAGQLPFNGGNYHALLQAILSGETPHLDTLVPGLPDGLSIVVHKAFARHRDARYQSAAELAAALLPFTTDRGAGDPPSGVRAHFNTPPPSAAAAAEPTLVEAAPASTELGTVRGTWCAEAIRILRSRHGQEAVQGWIGGLNHESAAHLTTMMLRVGRTPITALDALLNVALLAGGPASLRAVGSEIADLELSRGHRELRSATPAGAMERVGSLWSRCFDFGTARAVVRPDDAVVIQRTRIAHPGLNQLMAGFYTRVLQRCGAGRPAIESITVGRSADGAHTETRLQINWT